jgi:hypothetical protein
MTVCAITPYFLSLGSSNASRVVLRSDVVRLTQNRFNFLAAPIRSVISVNITSIGWDQNQRFPQLDHRQRRISLQMMLATILRGNCG